MKATTQLIVPQDLKLRLDVELTIAEAKQIIRRLDGDGWNSQSDLFMKTIEASIARATTAYDATDVEVIVER